MIDIFLIFAIVLLLLLLLLLLYKDAYRKFIKRFCKWFFICKIISIDYQQKIVFLIGPINHC